MDKQEKKVRAAVQMPSFQPLLEPWFKAIDNAFQAQEKTLTKLLEAYCQTQYGQKFGAGKVSSIRDFQECFPVVTYADLKPHIEKILQGDFSELLTEPPIEWGLTRGTTGESKLVPMTATDLTQKTACGARALLNYVERTRRYDILLGWDLNIGFPSKVSHIKVGEKQMTYGYTSGIYTKYNARNAQLRLVPKQEEIDALGGGMSKADWDRRFDLIYEKARAKEVTMLIGVTPVMIEFGKYLKRRHRVYPKDVWTTSLIVATSVVGIHTRYQPALKGLYGDVAIVEIYGGTEGMYAQQLDEKPFVTPNYDTYFFEVQTRQGMKLLCELKPGEYGSLIFSSVLFPRYKMGDLIRCMAPNYFRVVGRDVRFAMFKYCLGRPWEF